MTKTKFLELINVNKEKFALLDIRNSTMRHGYNRWTLCIIWKGALTTPIVSGMGRIDCDKAKQASIKYQNYLNENTN